MRVNGLRETLTRLNAFGVEGKKKIKEVTDAVGQEIATKATSNLAAYHDVDQNGEIRQSINAKSEENGYKSVISVNKVPMAAYIEFGTGTYVKVADEWKDIAWQFYVNGMGQLHPHPYFYPAFKGGSDQYLQDLQDALQTLTREFNSRT